MVGGAFDKARTALLLRTEMKILRAGKLSPLFHEVTVTKPVAKFLTIGAK